MSPWCRRASTRIKSMTHIGARAVHLFIICLMTLLMWCHGAVAADGPPASGAPVDSETAGNATDLDYHTPLAGEPLHTHFMGEAVDVPAQDRGHVTALTLGGLLFTPKQGNTAGTPIAAFYIKRIWERSRTRDMISIFVNDLEYEKSFGHLELVTRFENNTIPGGQTVVLNNQEIKASSVEWGTLIASLGPGLRYMVAPFQTDNDVRLQLLGRTGYYYSSRTSDTSPNVVLPPNTMLYGVKLRGRYDGIRRNLLELPHKGLASGFDLDYMHRADWSDFGLQGNTTFTKENTQDYVQFSGYLMGVTGIPWLSEKNRMLASLHGGIAKQLSVDRFNAFSIGGGPLQGETDDLNRPNYPGTMFNQIYVSDYLLAALEYRRELAFFLYLHLRGSFIWADQAAVSSTNQVIFKSSKGQAATIGLDSGFLWNSLIYFDYSWDSGFIRDGKSGSAFILTWNKAF
jgi:hypothetical protein